jgi:hypothetical protein
MVTVVFRPSSVYRRIAVDAKADRPLSIDAESTRKIFGRKTQQNQKRKILTVSASVICAARKNI